MLSSFVSSSSLFVASPWLSGLGEARENAIERIERFGAVTPEEYADCRGVELRDAHLDGADGHLVVGPLGVFIVLRDGLSERGRRWTIAHELGHLEMQHPAPPAAELCTPRPRRNLGAPWQRDYEDEATEWGMIFTMSDERVARFCDSRPLTLDVAEQLAKTAGVPLDAAAIRLTEVTFRVCAAVLSLHGKILWVSPSLRFLTLSGQSKLSPQSTLRPGSLARRFHDTGKLDDQAQLVPAAAWLDGMGSGAWLQEHSVPLDEPGRILTLLSTPSDLDAERDLRMTPSRTAFVRDYLMSSERALAEFSQRTSSDRPCPYAPTWFEALMHAGDGERLIPDRASDPRPRCSANITQSDEAACSATARDEPSLRSCAGSR
jgi:Zn-dependent peptidase ImmA (M78 family)